MSTSLREFIVGRIREEGPITFSEYMREALYHPLFGYYSSPQRGPGHDYRTSPNLTPLFGHLIARAIHKMSELLRDPPQFDVIEVGAGRGDLAHGVFDALDGQQGPSLRWNCVERFTGVAAEQRRRLEGRPVEWASEMSGLPPATGCLIANEVIDNFPVHLFEVTGDGHREIYVAAENGRLVQRSGPPSSAELAKMAAAATPHLNEGDRFELRPSLGAWCSQAAAALERGYLLVIDYGDVRPEIWTRRPEGTLVTYRREQIGDPLADPGHCDITAHVDFSYLAESCLASGFDDCSVVTQREFLDDLGLSAFDERLRVQKKVAQSEGRHADVLHLAAERGRLHTISSGGLGDLLVLVAWKDSPPYG